MTITRPKVAFWPLGMDDPVWAKHGLMNPFTALSAAEQVAEHLRTELLRGSFSGTMPGVNPLVAELGVNHKTVKSALRMLEDEGLLVNQGRGVQRRIALILDEPFLFNAGFHYLAKRGLRVPQDVSLVCTDGDPSFAWCQPSVAHIRWNYRPLELPPGGAPHPALGQQRGARQ